MPKLFGLDIAKILNDSIGDAGGVLAGTLTREEAGDRTPGDLAAGPSITTTTHSFRGFFEQRSEQRSDGSLVRTAGRFVSILGDSLPAAIVPRPGDRVTLEGSTFTVLELVSRDPAAALYVLRVED